jgi:hypothetical protein
MEEVLDRINKAVDEYNNLNLFDYHQLSEILRTLTANLFYLEKYRKEAHEEWLDVYKETEGTNANKERVADDKVRALYLLRRIMTSSYKIIDAIRSQISIYKKEG